MVCALVLPTFKFPNPTLVGLIESSGADTPVPESGMGDQEELLTTEILPLALPTTVGANIALNVKLCPTDSVMGRERPLTLNSVPLTVTAEIETLRFP